MAVNGAAAKNGVSMPIIIAAVVVLVALVAFFGYRAFNPPQPHTATMQKFDDWVSQLAKSSNRDFSKLNKADQDKLNQMTMGHGAQALKDAK